MNDFEAYEFAIKPKPTAKSKLKKTLMILLYVLFVAAWLVFGIVTRILVPLLALIPLTTWMLVFFTWRYVNVEYEYVVASGVLTISKIYDGRSRKQILSFEIRKATCIAPLGEKATSLAIDDYEPNLEYSFVSSPDSPDAYAVFIPDDGGDKIVAYLSLDDKLKKIFRFYNSQNAKF